MGNFFNGAITYFAVGSGACADKNFLGLVPWYHYLNFQADASGVCSATNLVILGSKSSFLLIGLALVDDLLRIVGLIAVLFVIYAGFQYITSQGSPEAAAKARTTAFNALIGLGITLVAIPFVSFLGARVDNTTGGSNSVGLDLSSLPNPAGVANGAVIPTVLTVIFTVIGAVSFMIIVIAGLKYVLSQGEPQATTVAKNAIIYALIGLVIAIAAQSAVSLVVNAK